MPYKAFYFPLLIAIVLTTALMAPAQAQETDVKPLAICSCQLTFLYNADCQLIVKAEDIDNGSYSPNGEDVTLKIFDYYRDPQEEILYEEACYGAYIQDLHLVVTSENGQSDTCQSFVEFQIGYCHGDLIEPCYECQYCYPISGSFYTPAGIPINKVDLFLNGKWQGQFNQSFCFFNDQADSYYDLFIIEPEKEDDVRRGLSVLDLVLIRAAQLEKVELSHFQKIAADVSNNEKVSLRDAIELKQVLLYGLEEFSQSPAWRFIPTNHEFGADTWERPIPYTYEIDYESREKSFDFVGVKMGDVSGDSWGRSHSRNESAFTVTTDNLLLEAGEETTVFFKSGANKQTSGYQFTLEFDPTQLAFIDLTGPVSKSDLNLERLEDGLISIVKLVDSKDDETLLKLHVQAKADVQLADNLDINSKLIPALAYNDKYEEMNIELTFTNQADKNTLYQNAPNPFANLTNIGFRMAKAGEASLVIMDSQGRVLLERKAYYEAGYNSESFDKAKLPASGLYYYQLKAGEFTGTKKMLVVN